MIKELEIMYQNATYICISWYSKISAEPNECVTWFIYFLDPKITVPVFNIVVYVWQILVSYVWQIFGAAHLKPAPKRPILNRVKDHKQNVLNKVSEIMALLRKPQKSLPRSPLLTINKSFIRLHLDYADIIYDQA